jgi:hypothetical protein
MGNYKIITIGLSIGSFASELQGNATVLSPGLLGANPKNLTGPVSFGSVGSYVTDGVEGMGTTLITMGYGHAECTDSYGYDITLASYASGWSFLSGPSYYYCPF